MKNWFTKNKKWAILAIVLVVAVAAAGLIYTLTKPQTSVGAKTITVQVVDAAKQSTDFSISTDSEYLRGALEEQKLVAGEESQYGLFIKTVNGYTADDSKQEWWCITKGGETVMTGADSTPIANGDQFELTLTTGY
ncbi:MAG: DUF4430 domain-containing protein [Eubacteriales bacterium]|nr:DUF4430 domain-containing protein [Eubacteriales bacterium]